MDLCFSHSLLPLIAQPIRTTEHTKTLTDHILTNSPEKVVQSGLIEMELSNHELIHCEVVYVTIGNPDFCLALYFTGVHFRGELQHVGRCNNSSVDQSELEK